MLRYPTDQRIAYYYRILIPPLLIDQDLCLFQGVKDLTLKQLVFVPAAERLVKFPELPVSEHFL